MSPSHEFVTLVLRSRRIFGGFLIFFLGGGFPQRSLEYILANQEVRGTEIPSGVQGLSPGTGSGGQSLSPIFFAHLHIIF